MLRIFWILQVTSGILIILSPFWFSEVFNTSMIVKKLSDVVKEITELDVLEHRAVPDIDSLVST